MIDSNLNVDIPPKERRPKPTIKRGVKVGDRVTEFTHSSGPTIEKEGEVIYVGEYFYRVRFDFPGGSYVEAYPLYVATGVLEEREDGHEV